MAVLITGGAGFIGSHVADRLLARGEIVVALDALDEQVHPEGRWPSYLDRRVIRVKGNIADRDSVMAAFDAASDLDSPIDRVIHLAAVVGVGQSAYEIERYVSENVSATAALFESLVEIGGIRRVVTAGSMSCYGEGLYEWILPGGMRRTGKGVIRSESDLAKRKWDAVLPYHANPSHRWTPVGTNEQTPFVCTSVYAETKRSQEELTRLVFGPRGISWSVARFFNVYGARQSVSNPYTGVAAIFSSQIRSGRAPTIYEDGDQSRDFIDVRDVAAAVVALLDSEGAIGAFNVGTGQRTSIRDLAEALLRVYGREDLGVEIRGTYRVGDVRHCFADAGRLTDLGWTPKIGLDSGLADLARWVESVEVDDRTDRAHQTLVSKGMVR